MLGRPWLAQSDFVLGEQNPSRRHSRGRYVSRETVAAPHSRELRISGRDPTRDQYLRFGSLTGLPSTPHGRQSRSAPPSSSGSQPPPRRQRDGESLPARREPSTQPRAGSLLIERAPHLHDTTQGSHDVLTHPASVGQGRSAKQPVTPCRAVRLRAGDTTYSTTSHRCVERWLRVTKAASQQPQETPDAGRAAPAGILGGSGDTVNGCISGLVDTGLTDVGYTGPTQCSTELNCKAVGAVRLGGRLAIGARAR